MITLLKVLFCIILFPLMLAWELFKGLIGLADSMERTRKRNSRHRGVMCGPGGSRRRRR